MGAYVYIVYVSIYNACKPIHTKKLGYSRLLKLILGRNNTPFLGIHPYYRNRKKDCERETHTFR